MGALNGTARVVLSALLLLADDTGPYESNVFWYDGSRRDPHWFIRADFQVARGRASIIIAGPGTPAHRACKKGRSGLTLVYLRLRAVKYKALDWFPLSHLPTCSIAKVDASSTNMMTAGLVEASVKADITITFSLDLAIDL